MCVTVGVEAENSSYSGTWTPYGYNKVTLERMMTLKR